YGDRPLLIAGPARLSFHEISTLAARFAGTLATAGIRRGDRVALMCSNRVEFVQVYLGCAWLGAIAVPINLASRGPQLAHMLGNSGARLLVMEADLVAALDHVDSASVKLERIWLIGDEQIGASHQPVPVTGLPPPGEAVAFAEVEPGETA